MSDERIFPSLELSNLESVIEFDYASFFDSFDLYGRGGSITEGRTAEELFGMIEENVAPEYVIAAIDRLANIYLDQLIDAEEENTLALDTDYGLIEIKVPDYARWKQEEEILNVLMETGKSSVGAYYGGDLLDADIARDILLQYEAEIIESCGDAKAKKYHLSEKYDKIGNFGDAIEPKLTGNDKPDCVVYVASGAYMPAALLASRMNVPLIAVRYSRFGCGDDTVKVPFNMPYGEILKQFNGKNVLVVEDSSINGESIANVMNYVAECGATKVRGTTVECAQGMQNDLKNGLKIDASIDAISAENEQYLFEYNPLQAQSSMNPVTASTPLAIYNYYLIDTSDNASAFESNQG